MRRISAPPFTYIPQVEVDLSLIQELRALDSALNAVVNEGAPEEPEKAQKGEDPWEALLKMAEKKTRVTVVMYETSV